MVRECVSLRFRLDREICALAVGSANDEASGEDTEVAVAQPLQEVR